MRGRDAENEPYFVIEQPSNGIGTFLLGLALGAGAALLLAPRVGAETRRVLGERAREMRDSAMDMVEEMTETVQSSVADAKGRVQDHVDEAKGRARRGKQSVEDAIVAGKSAAHEARVELERKLAEQKASHRRDDGRGDETLADVIV